MGTPDTAIKDFLRIPRNFADVCNLGLFDGITVQAESLQPLNTNLVAGLFHDGGTRIDKGIQRYLDEAKIGEAVIMDDGTRTIMMVGMQAQQSVHYAMPVRVQMDVSLMYKLQVDSIANENRRKIEEIRKKKEEVGAKGLSEKERKMLELWHGSDVFLSGLFPWDKLHPVIVVTLYCGREPWNGPCSIYSMLETNKENVLKYSYDYGINLVTLSDLAKGPMTADSEVSKVAHMVTTGYKSINEFWKISSEGKYESVYPETIKVVNTLLGVGLKIKKDERGKVDVRTATTEYNWWHKRQIDEKDKEIARYRTRNATLETKAATLETKAATLETKAATLETKAATLETENATLKTEAATLKTENAEMNRTMAEMARRIAELEAQQAKGQP